MVLIYKEARSACETYAKAHDLEMVLRYNEPVDAVEIDSGVNIQRKVEAGALLPLYMAPGLDVSESILDILNKQK